MTDVLMSDAELVRRLGLHPELRSQIESLVLAAQDRTGEFKTAAQGDDDKRANASLTELVHDGLPHTDLEQDMSL